MFARTRRTDVSIPSSLLRLWREPADAPARSPRRIAALVGQSGTVRPPVLEGLEERRLLASVLVVANATLIEDGEDLARDFGYEQISESARSREFVIANVGSGNVTLGDLQAPAGFRITQDIADTTLAPDETTTFRISLDPNSTAGAKAGDVVFLATDTDGSMTYNFAVAGTLTAAGGPRVVGFAPDKTGGFWVDFDEALDADTVTTEAVRAYTAGADGLLNTDDDQLIAGSVDYLTDRRQIRFTPDAAVVADYRVEVLGVGAKAITALGGELLDGEFFAALPSGNGTPGGTFNASVDVSARTDIARFDTVLGIIDVVLTPGVTPITVNNFYSYADAGDWDMSFIHRSVQEPTLRIFQGGGYYYDNGAAVPIDADAPIQNEFQQGLTSNTRGTIAMAKKAGQPNSATNQWFFNNYDNSDNLDAQNGGFTTFGEIVAAAGLEVMDHIASLGTVNAGQTFPNLPLRDVEDDIDNENLVVMRRISSLVQYAPLTQGAVWEVVLDDGNETPAQVFDFGNVSAGQQKSQDFLVVNRGTEAVTITLAQGLAAPFSLTPANGQGDQDDWVLQPGESAAFTITYAPTASGAHADQLSLTAPGGSPDSLIVDVNGTAVPLTPSSVQLAAAYDTGRSNTDRVTNLNNEDLAARLGFVVSGVEAGATVTIYANGVSIGSGVVADGDTSITVLTSGQTLLLDGEVAITAKQARDGATSAASQALIITIDTHAPTLTGASDATVTQGTPVSIDLGSDDEDDEADPRYAFTQAPGGATLNAVTGVINWNPTGADVGENPFVVTVTDVAGNVTTRSFAITVVPLAPSGVDLAATSDTGLSNTDNITNRNNSSNQKKMSLRVDDVLAGATIRVYAGSTLIGQGVVGDGDDSILITTNGTAALADGTYQITATQTVGAFTSNASLALSIQVDTFGPIIEALDSFSVSAGQPFDEDLESDDEDAGKQVIYSLAQAPAGATVNPTTGVITWTPLDTQVGIQHFVAAATDVAGNVSQEEFDVEVLGTGLGEEGLTFNGNLTGRGSERRFIVEPTLTGAFIVSLDGVDPAGRIELYHQATGQRLTRPANTNVRQGLPASVSFIGTAGVTYEVVVKAQGNAVGGFVLDVAYDPDGRFQDANVIPADLVDLGDEGDALRFLASADIDSLLDRDFYTFTPATGGDTAFSFTALGGLQGEMNVYTYQNGLLNRVKRSVDRTGAGASFTTTLQAGVQYVLDLASLRGRSSGGYDLVVEVDSNSSMSSPAPLGAFATTLTIDGELLHRRDDDWFSFTPTTSGALLYDTSAEDGMRMQLTFVDAASGQLLSRSAGRGGSLPFGRFEITAGRTVLMLAEARGNSMGDYTVNLGLDDFGAASAADPLDLAVTPQGSESDGLTGGVTGAISSNLDEDFYSFTPASGYTSGFFRVAASGGGLSTFATLYADQGGTLQRLRNARDRGDGAEIRADLTPGTQYFLVVESQRGQSTGSYTIEVELDGNDSAAGADDLGDLSLDPIEVLGELQHNRDADWFAFTPQLTSAVLYDMTGEDGMRMKLSFFNAASGELLSRSTGTGGSLPFGRFEVAAGQEVLVLAEARGRSTGDYAINLAYDDLGGASAADGLTLTQTIIGSEVDGLIAEVAGEVSSQLDHDFYTFTAPAGYTSGYFAAVATGGELMTSATLYAEEGGSLNRVGAARDRGDGAELREDLQAGTDYYLVVESHRGRSTGEYTVEVELDGNHDLQSADGLGEIAGATVALSGEILDRRDDDLFAFTAAVSGTFTVDEFLGGGTIRPRVTVYSADGRRIARKAGTTDNFNPLTTEVSAGATYFLEIATRGNNPGTYQFSLRIT